LHKIFFIFLSLEQDYYRQSFLKCRQKWDKSHKQIINQRDKQSNS